MKRVVAAVSKKSSAAVGASLVVVSSIFYASYGVWTVLMGSGFGSYLQAGLRSVLVVAYLLPLALWHKQLAKVHYRRDAWWFAGLFVSSAFTAAPLYYATLHIGIGLATALSYIGIVLGLFFFGWLFSRERFTRDKLLSTILGLLGIWLVFSPSLQAYSLLALAAALVSGLAVALNVVTVQKMPYNATQSTVLTWSVGALVNLPVGFLLHQTVPAWGIGWVYLAIFAVVSLAASWSVIRGSKLIAAGAVGILGLLEVVFGVVFGMVFFSERPDVVVLLGMGLILVAAAVPYVQHLKVKDEPFRLTETKGLKSAE